MKNLFIKIMLMINALASVYPCVNYIITGMRWDDLHYLFYFAVFHAIQIILSVAMFIYICKSEKNKSKSDNSDDDDR
jgi:hypothetical protein